MLENETFTFTLEEVEGGDFSAPAYSETKQVSGAAHGVAAQIAFSAVQYDQEEIGTHIYEIRETKGAAPGVTYDGRVYRVTVEVSDSGAGQPLQAQVTAIAADGEAAQGVSFENTYEARGSYTPQVAKALTGRDMLEGEAFTFVLQETGGAYRDEATISALSDGAGTVSFKPIMYTEQDVGEHVYTIAEQGEDGNGLTHDTSVYTLTVDVTDNGDGTLKVDGKVTLNGEEAPSGALFTNTYLPEPTTYTPAVAKVIEGDARPEEKAFAFTLEKEDDGNTSELGAAEATVTGEGEAQFGAITFREAGTYRFILRETAGSETGYTYDQGYWLLEVVVDDDLQGTLSVTGHDYTYYSSNQPTQTTAADKATFTNRYDVTDTSWTPAVRKRVEGEAMPTDGEFTFALTRTGGDASGVTMPEQTALVLTVSKDSREASGNFPSVSFHKAGTYAFRIAETESPDGYAARWSDGTVEVVVVDDGAALKVAQVTYRYNGETSAQEMLFINDYSTEGTTFTPQVHKALE